MDIMAYNLVTVLLCNGTTMVKSFKDNTKHIIRYDGSGTGVELFLALYTNMEDSKNSKNDTERNMVDVIGCIKQAISGVP